MIERLRDNPRRVWFGLVPCALISVATIAFRRGTSDRARIAIMAAACQLVPVLTVMLIHFEISRGYVRRRGNLVTLSSDPILFWATVRFNVLVYFVTLMLTVVFLVRMVQPP